MPRRNDPSQRQQRSKRARSHRKQAEHALPKWLHYMAHPSHVAYRKTRRYARVRRNWDWLLLTPYQRHLVRMYQGKSL